MKILLLEDNKTLNETIKLKFERSGHKVYSYLDGQEALNNITHGFSCFILDVNVPNVDGIKILKKIREYYDEVPVIIISATVELNIIRECYDFGCNDYLKKPFFIEELEIKVKNICKITKKDIYFDENYFFNFKESKLRNNEKQIKLNQKENLLMNLFLMNQNKIVTYDNIQNYVWEGEYTSLDSIRTLITRLRKKLSKNYIQVFSNRGYCFIVNYNNL